MERVPFDMNLMYDKKTAWSYITPWKLDYNFFSRSKLLFRKMEQANNNKHIRVFVVDYNSNAVIITKEQLINEDDILYKTICEIDKDIMFIIFEYDRDLKAKYYALFDKFENDVHINPLNIF